MPLEREIDLDFPLRGIDVIREFSLQPPLTTPVGVNVRGYDRIAGRERGGSRPGLSRYIPAQIPEGAVALQDLNVVVYDDDEALLYNLLPDPGTPTTENPQIPGTFVPTGGSGIQPNPNVNQQSDPDPVPNWFIGEITADGGGGSFTVQFAGGGASATITVDGSPSIPVGATVLFIKRNGTYAVQPVNWVT